MPVTKNFYLEKGTYLYEEREGPFEFIDPDKNVYKLVFDNNKLVDVLESPGVPKEKLFKMMQDSQNFWSYDTYLKTRTDDSKTLLDYLKDKMDKKEALDPEYVYKEVNQIVERGKLRIENLEIFALLQWKLTIVNDIEEYLELSTPDNFKSIYDEDAKVEPEEINKDLLNQAK